MNMYDPPKNSQIQPSVSERAEKMDKQEQKAQWTENGDAGKITNASNNVTFFLFYCTKQTWIIIILCCCSQLIAFGGDILLTFECFMQQVCHYLTVILWKTDVKFWHVVHDE